MAPIYSGGLKLDPLIGVSIGVDLVPVFGEMGPIGAAVKWIVDVVEYLFEVDIYIVFELFLAVKGEASLSYNKVDGFGKSLSQKVDAEVGVALKAGASSN